MTGDYRSHWGCSLASVFGLLLCLSGCGRTHEAAPSPAEGEAGAGALSAVEGGAGAGALDADDLELAPYLKCSGAYESLPTSKPPRALPTVLEAELCNSRDSRVWVIDVVAEQAVSITLENPLSVDTFQLDVYRPDEGYEHLPVSAGVTSAALGRLAERSFSFTPVSSGSVGLYAGLGSSRGEATRLRVEQ